MEGIPIVASATRVTYDKKKVTNDYQMKFLVQIIQGVALQYSNPGT